MDWVNRKLAAVTFIALLSAFSSSYLHALTCTDLDGAYVASQETNPTYLGFFGSQYASASIMNTYGTYGSPYNAASVRNAYGNYGSSYGGSPITEFEVTCGNQHTSGPVSPITVSRLTNGLEYSCTVVAVNTVGTSIPSVPMTGTPEAIPPGLNIILLKAAMDAKNR